MKTHADSTLMRMTKAELIECLRCAEHNQTVAENMLAQQFENVKSWKPVVHGEWLLKHIGHGHYWECSVCHAPPNIYITENTKFCPNCGAKMEDEDG